jgi:hypothetical protein
MSAANARRLLLLLAALTAVLLACTSPALAATGAQNRVGAFNQAASTPARDLAAGSSCTHQGSILPSARSASGFCVATEGGVDIGSANFAQTTYGEAFSSGGRFAGQSIDDVAGAIRSGELSPEDVPIEAINRDGNTLILNTRSAQALERAGIPRSEWNVVNVTGDSAAEARLSGQLARNGLTSSGYPSPTSSGG